MPAREVVISDRVSLLADVAELVSRSHDLPETLSNVVDLVAKRLDADVCSVYLTDPDRRHLTLKATKGLDPQAVDNVRLAFGDGLVGRAAERAEPVAIEFASDSSDYHYFPETGEERYESLLAAPLSLNSLTIGVLVIQTIEARPFDQPDVEMLQTCAQLLTPVVMNAELLSVVGRSGGDQVAEVVDIARSRIPTIGKLVPSLNEFSGLATARGIAIGPVHRIQDPTDLDSIPYQSSGDPQRESRALLEALGEARRDLDETRDVMGDRFGPEFAAVFYAQTQMLEDKGFVLALEEAVAQSHDAREALRSVLSHYRQTFESIEDSYFRERGADVQEVGQRVLRKLLGIAVDQVDGMAAGAVVVVDQMLPGLFARLDLDRVGALVSEHGGATSHGAIFARTLEIPAVAGVSGIVEAAREGELAIVDGGEGRVLLSPDDALVDEYRLAQERYAVAVEHLDALRGRPAETRDGRRISLTANLGLRADVRLIDQHGAEGVGLFRTELLALAHGGFPSEEEQARFYEQIALLLVPRPLTVRTFDFGGDKQGVPNLGLEREDNPQLGCRSIRLTLENDGVFRGQLRAILRASAAGNLRLLFPMISSIEELRAARGLLAEVMDELDAAGVPFDREIPVGIMIEVPSTAILAPVFAQECDFFSIGTNDLTQYTLAVDRGNERVAHLYDPLHPAVLALIDTTRRAAAKARIPVAVCGEMASNPLAVPLLIGLGISELSGVPGAVPLVKEIVRAFDAGDLDTDARRALAASSASEVHEIAGHRLRASGLLEHPDIGDWIAGILARKGTAASA